MRDGRTTSEDSATQLLNCEPLSFAIIITTTQQVIEEENSSEGGRDGEVMVGKVDETKMPNSNFSGKRKLTPMSPRVSFSS